MKTLLSVLILLFVLATQATAQEKTPPLLEKRAVEIVAAINEPKDLEKTFAPGFLAQVPLEKFAEISKSLTDEYGKAARVIKIIPRDDFGGEIQILFEKNSIVKMNLQLEKAAPNLIEGLLVTGIEKTTASLDEIVGELKKLPGQTNFAVLKLNEKDFLPVIAHNADTKAVRKRA